MVIPAIISVETVVLFSFNLKNESLAEFKLISKIYFNEKLEKEYKLEEIFSC